MNIIPRADWGARPPKNPPRIIGETPELWLHHSASPSGYAARVRAIQNFHMDVRGWNDIAYSFLVNHAGQVYEGRGFGIAGAHTKGHNSISHAICLMGHYNQETPTDAALTTLRNLLVFGHERDWWPATFTGGHRDTRGGDAGDCPGDNLYPLIPQLNEETMTKDEILEALGLGGHHLNTLKSLHAAFDDRKADVEGIQKRTIDHVRNPHTGGMSEADGDVRYVRKGQPVSIKGLDV